MALGFLRSPLDDMAPLAAEVMRMGGLAESQVADAVDAVARRDVPLAQAVIARDAKVDALQRDIDHRAVQMVASRRLGARDLRRPLTAMRIASELERTGDLARSIARRGLQLADADPIQEMTRALDRMGKLVGSRLRTVLDAYAGSDLPMATRVWRTDDEVDEHYNALFVQLVGGMTRDGRTIPTCAHMLSMAKNLERIGDHATNIAEHVHYELTGAAPEGERPHFSAARDAQGASR